MRLADAGSRATDGGPPIGCPRCLGCGVWEDALLGRRRVTDRTTWTCPDDPFRAEQGGRKRLSDAACRLFRPFFCATPQGCGPRAVPASSRSAVHHCTTQCGLHHACSHADVCHGRFTRCGVHHPSAVRAVLCVTRAMLHCITRFMLLWTGFGRRDFVLKKLIKMAIFPRSGSRRPCYRGWPHYHSPALSLFW